MKTKISVTDNKINTEDNIGKMENLLLEVEDLNDDDLLKLADHLQELINVRFRTIVVASTGYCSRLVQDRDQRTEFIARCCEEKVKPILLIDDLWGDGAYYDVTAESVKTILYKHKRGEEINMGELAAKLPNDLQDLFLKHGTYGRIFFEVENDKWNPEHLLKEMEYCCIYGFGGVEIQHLPGARILIYDFDTESG